MWEDPIVAEIRKVRHAHAAKFNNDIAAIFADIRRQEKESGRQYVGPSISACWAAALNHFRGRPRYRAVASAQSS